MSRAIILQHQPHAGPGRIVPIFRDFGIPIEIRKLWLGDEVPTDLDELRLLVVLGGRKFSDLGHADFPYLATELSTLQRMVAIDRPVLGIEFGAQMLAHAAGAKVHPNVKVASAPHGAPQGAPPAEAGSPALVPEYGWGPVQFPFPGGTEPMVFGMTDGAPMFHWHDDAFDLPRLPTPPNAAPPPAPPPPAGNALLSSSRLCKTQAFRFKNRLFGFQYHFELTEPDIEAYCAAGKDDLVRALGTDAVAKVREQTPQFYPRYARLGEKLTKNFVQFLRAY